MKKENLSRIIVAGLIATSINVYTNVDNSALAFSGNKIVSRDYVDEQNIKQNNKIMQNTIHNIIQDYNNKKQWEAIGDGIIKDVHQDAAIDAGIQHDKI